VVFTGEVREVDDAFVSEAEFARSHPWLRKENWFLFELINATGHYIQDFLKGMRREEESRNIAVIAEVATKVGDAVLKLVRLCLKCPNRCPLTLRGMPRRCLSIASRSSPHCAISCPLLGSPGLQRGITLHSS